MHAFTILHVPIILVSMVSIGLLSAIANLAIAAQCTTISGLILFI